MFVEKRQLIAIFETELEAWENLLAGLDPQEVTSRWLPGGLSVKDTLAHLTAWLQRTIAQLDAALRDRAPRYPDWPVELDEAESSDAVDRANAWILEANRERPWADVHREWREAFLRFLELIREIREPDLLPGAKLAWMAEYEPSEVLPGAYDHHHSEHRGWLVERIRERANRQPGS